MIQNTVLQTYVELGTQACRVGHLALAEKMFRAVSEEAQKEDQNHARLAQSFLQIAQAYAERQEYKKAASFYRRALSLYNYALGQYNEFSASVLDNLAGLYQKQGKLGQASLFCVRAVIASERSLAPDRKRLAERTMNLAWLHIQQGKRAEADNAFRKSLQYQRELNQSGTDLD